MKLAPSVSLLFALLVLGGCLDGSSSTPTSPEVQLQPPAPVPQPEASGLWSLDLTFRSAEGPESNCMVQDRRQEVGSGWTDQALQVVLEQGRYEISYMCDDFFWCAYSGELDGLRFAARGASWSGNWTCSSGESFAYEAFIDISGAFSADLNTIAAIERWIYRTPDGEVVVTLDFLARKQP